jgi:hypothetical protein
MQKTKLGLVKNWDGPWRRFVYLFTPGDNDTLEIIELEEHTFQEDLPCNRELHELPAEVAAEINISMGAAGMLALKPNWWGRRKAQWWLFKNRWRMRWIKLTRKPV